MRRSHLENQSRLRNVARFIPLGVWLVILTYLSLISGDNLKSSWMSTIPNKDKVFHFGAYLGLAVLMMYGLSKLKFQLRFDKRIFTIAFCVVWGVSIEFLQGAMPMGRHFEIFDIIANIIGAFVGVGICDMILKKNNYGS